MPVGAATLGRLWNVIGEPIDEQGPIARGTRALVDPSRPARVPRPLAEDRDLRDRHQGHRPHRAVRQGRQDRPLRRRRRRQDGPHPGADPQRRAAARRRVGLRRRRRAHARGQRPLARDDRVGRHRQGRARLRADERAAGRASARRSLRPDDGRVLPRPRARTCCSSSTTSSASSRQARRSRHCSAACRAPSATSRRSRPRWASSRSGSPRRRPARSRRCRRSTCPPTTSTDPAPANTFAHLDSTTVLERSIVEKGIYPAVDPLELELARAPAGDRLGRALRGRDARAADPPALRRPAGHHRDPRHGRAHGRGQGRRRARAPHRALPLAAELRRRAVHRHARAST